MNFSRFVLDMDDFPFLLDFTVGLCLQLTRGQVSVFRFSAAASVL
jgi:hypothetical protein